MRVQVAGAQLGQGLAAVQFTLCHGQVVDMHERLRRPLPGALHDVPLAAEGADQVRTPALRRVHSGRAEHLVDLRPGEGTFAQRPVQRLPRDGDVRFAEPQSGASLLLRTRHPRAAQPHHPTGVLGREEVEGATHRPGTHDLVPVDGGDLGGGAGGGVQPLRDEAACP